MITGIFFVTFIEIICYHNKDIHFIGVFSLKTTCFYDESRF